LASLKQYGKYSAFLPSELCLKNIKGFGLRKGPHRLDAVSTPSVWTVQPNSQTSPHQSGQLRLDHFKVPIQVIFGGLARGKASKHPLRRSFPPRHVHIAHPYQRDLQLILEPPVHHSSFSRSVALLSSKPLPAHLAFPNNLRFLSSSESIAAFSCSGAGRRKIAHDTL
jgi:hypothetical protein